MDDQLDSLVQRALENQSPELEKLLEVIASLFPSVEQQNEQEEQEQQVIGGRNCN